MKLAAVAAVLLVALASANAAEACSCVRIGEDAPGAELSASALVLLARVTEVVQTPPPPEMGDLPPAYWPKRVTLVPERVWKGLEKAEYVTISDAPWNTCGFPFKLGERYLIYSKDGRIPAEQCDPIYLLKDAQEQVRRLDKAIEERYPIERVMAAAAEPRGLCVLPPEASSARSAQRAAKGVELYSWKAGDGEMLFSLLWGTNRRKALSEVQSQQCTLRNPSEVKAAMGRLAVGEHVFWMWTAEECPSCSYPTSKIIDELVMHAQKLELSLETGAGGRRP